MKLTQKRLKRIIKEVLNESYGDMFDQSDINLDDLDVSLDPAKGGDPASIDELEEKFGSDVLEALEQHPERYEQGKDGLWYYIGG